QKYREGYPRYAALLNAHPALHNFRRFTRVRMRLLLLKQDEITVLEEKLDQIDDAEARELNLGCARLDNSEERLQVVDKLRSSLAEYDEMLQHGHRTLSLPKSSEREVQNLKDWTAGTCCISRQETDYLERSDDLANLTGSPDIAISYVESLVEDCIHRLDGLIEERHELGWSTARKRRLGRRVPFSGLLLYTGKNARCICVRGKVRRQAELFTAAFPA
ncbi:hypothetical protein PG997_015280, partial [Apiospora hydei]